MRFQWPTQAPVSDVTLIRIGVFGSSTVLIFGRRYDTEWEFCLMASVHCHLPLVVNNQNATCLWQSLDYQVKPSIGSVTVRMLRRKDAGLTVLILEHGPCGHWGCQTLAHFSWRKCWESDCTTTCRVLSGRKLKGGWKHMHEHGPCSFAWHSHPKFASLPANWQASSSNAGSPKHAGKLLSEKVLSENLAKNSWHVDYASSQLAQQSILLRKQIRLFYCSIVLYRSSESTHLLNLF